MNWLCYVPIKAQELGQHKSFCPHLGLIHDAATHMNFPSSANLCLNCKTPESPSLIYQQKYCLTHADVGCVLKQASLKIPMPAEISAASLDFSRIAWAVVVFPLLVASIYFIFSRAHLLALDFFIKTDSASFLIDPTVSVVITPNSADQILDVKTSPSPTPVFLTPFHTYEVTRLLPHVSYALLVHVIKPDETLELLAVNYGTTAQAIIAVNYKLTRPIWAEYPIVIPVGTKDVAGSPAFKVYVVKDYATIHAETLANILAVDAKALEFYNLCTADCEFSRGDVLLIPHNH